DVFLHPKQAAIVILTVLKTYAERRPRRVSRVRISDLTLRRLLGRPRLTREFLAEVEDYLWQAGWCLFGGIETYALIRTDAVGSWARVSSMRFPEILDALENGKFDFDGGASLLHPINEEEDEDADSEGVEE